MDTKDVEMKKDIILGTFSNYTYDQIRYWINSIHMSGFVGDVVVVVGNAKSITVEQLIQNGVKVIAFGREGDNFYCDSSLPIQTERFFHFWNFLKDNWQNYRYVITTDMKDVVFQTNPSDYLTRKLHTKLLFATECLKYQDEPWGRENLQQAFGQYFYECFRENTIYNVGVIAGDAEYMKDLCLNIFQMSVNRPIPIVEQAAFNALIQTQPYKDVGGFKNMDRGWCANLGTVMDPRKIDQFRPFLLEPEPHIWNDATDPEKKNELYLATVHDDVICVVHQYDRVPFLKNYFEQKYGVNNAKSN